MRPLGRTWKESHCDADMRKRCSSVGARNCPREENCSQSSYSKVFSVIHDSGSVPEKTSSLLVRPHPSWSLSWQAPLVGSMHHRGDSTSLSNWFLSSDWQATPGVPLRRRLLERRRPELPTVHRSASVVNWFLSVVNWFLSIVNWFLSVVN
jgi:hypothetical protein